VPRLAKEATYQIRPLVCIARAMAFMRPVGRCMTGQLLRTANWRGGDPVPNNAARLRQNAAEVVLWARLIAGAKLYLVAIE
jgi:hypothetical protein